MLDFYTIEIWNFLKNVRFLYYRNFGIFQNVRFLYYRNLEFLFYKNINKATFKQTISIYFQ